ncbi:hypothetical protein, partial [Gordonia effusa]|uniref:hypothetical protein n=1 Tax=Gordonia effusa TaxID=263908 RepID=UPI001B8D2080
MKKHQNPNRISKKHSEEKKPQPNPKTSIQKNLQKNSSDTTKTAPHKTMRHQKMASNNPSHTIEFSKNTHP